MKKYLAGIILGLVIIAGGIGLYQYKQPAPSPNQTRTEVVANDRVSYQGENGKTALELLEKSHKVEAETSSFGKMVKSIDGRAADTKHFWGFYVNGTMAPTGADTYVTKASESIEWKYEEMPTQ